VFQVLGIIGWSIATKVRTGSGLPAGPSGLLGAVEGVSYLSLLGGEAHSQQQQAGYCSSGGASSSAVSHKLWLLEAGHTPGGSNRGVTQQWQQHPHKWQP
jgi:hypothetical protein